MPRVTVILSTYNWSSVLPYSIGSVTAQTYSDWELLVIGDGCTDDSPAVVQTLREKDGTGRIRWINLTQNTGNQCGPNNEGLKQARGELIAYLGHDDLWLPHHLESLVAAIDEGADVAHSILRWVTPPGEKTAPYDFEIDRLVAPSSVVHRLSVAQSVGGWRDHREITTSADYDFWCRIREAHFKVVAVKRLSVIKFPAPRRRDVYKTRPFHEQAAWQERIENEADFETTQLAEIIVDAVRAFKPPSLTFWQQLKVLLHRVPIGLKVRWRRIRPKKAGSLVEASRVDRGLDPKL